MFVNFSKLSLIPFDECQAAGQFFIVLLLDSMNCAVENFVYPLIFYFPRNYSDFCSSILY